LFYLTYFSTYVYSLIRSSKNGGLLDILKPKSKLSNSVFSTGQIGNKISITSTRLYRPETDYENDEMVRLNTSNSSLNTSRSSVSNLDKDDNLTVVSEASNVKNK
jgi:hypothetical protein